MGAAVVSDQDYHRIHAERGRITGQCLAEKEESGRAFSPRGGEANGCRTDHVKQRPAEIHAGDHVRDSLGANKG